MMHHSPFLRICHPRRPSLARGHDAVRVGLINDGAYPYRQSIAGTWCHRLIRGMPEHTFHVIAVPDHEPRVPFYAPTANTEAFTSVAAEAWSERRVRRVALVRRQLPLPIRRAATHASVLLCRGMMSDTPGGLAMFRSGMHQLATIDTSYGDPMRGVPLAAALLDAWRAADGTEDIAATAAGRLPVARPAAGATRADAEHAAAVMRSTLRLVGACLPSVDLNHAVDAGGSGLLALAAKWRSGTPFVLTEHHPYRHAVPRDDGSATELAHLMAARFHGALARLVYAEAAHVVAPVERMRRWAVDHGADPTNLTLTGYGVDPHSCPPLRGEPPEQTITFVGPESDAATMLTSLPWIRWTRPDARLIVAGPAFAADPLALANVSFLGPVNHRRSAYATGRIVVISGRDPAAPYAIVEAMMCGRPAICLDDGEFRPMVGPAALTVPYGDPARLARACLALLNAADQRRQMSSAGARRARSLYALRTTIDVVRIAYQRAVGLDPPEATDLADHGDGRAVRRHADNRIASGGGIRIPSGSDDANQRVVGGTGARGRGRHRVARGGLAELTRDPILTAGATRGDPTRGDATRGDATRDGPTRSRAAHRAAERRGTAIPPPQIGRAHV